MGEPASAEAYDVCIRSTTAGIVSLLDRKADQFERTLRSSIGTIPCLSILKLTCVCQLPLIMNICESCALEVHFTIGQIPHPQTCHPTHSFQYGTRNPVRSILPGATFWAHRHCWTGGRYPEATVHSCAEDRAALDASGPSRLIRSSLTPQHRTQTCTLQVP